MLIYQDSIQLGDHILSPREELARQEEKTRAMHEKYKEYRQDELEDVERASGPRLQFSELVSKLRRIVFGLKVLDGIPGNVALYVPRTRKEMAELGKRDESRDRFFHHYKYVGGFPKESIPEYGYITTDENGLFADELRGWRTVLIRLIKSGAVSYQAVVKEFREPHGSRAWRWNQELQKFRK